MKTLNVLGMVALLTTIATGCALEKREGATETPAADPCPVTVTCNALTEECVMYTKKTKTTCEVQIVRDGDLPVWN